VSTLPSFGGTLLLLLLPPPPLLAALCCSCNARLSALLSFGFFGGITKPDGGAFFESLDSVILHHNFFSVCPKYFSVVTVGTGYSQYFGNDTTGSKREHTHSIMGKSRNRSKRKQSQIIPSNGRCEHNNKGSRSNFTQSKTNKEVISKRKPRQKIRRTKSHADGDKVVIVADGHAIKASNLNIQVNFGSRKQKIKSKSQNNRKRKQAKNSNPKADVASITESTKTLFRPSKPELGHKQIILEWKSPFDYVSNESETAMVSVIFSGKTNEYGMMKDLPKSQLARIQQKATMHQMSIEQVESLRRHHILRLQHIPNASSVMGLGSDLQIRNAAQTFETCVGAFLNQWNIPFLTEQEQIALQPKGSSTPDCLLRETILVRWKDSTQLYHVNWVECKMFYGANTIPWDGKSAVGKILSIAKKYVHFFGPGIMCFRQGCGQSLATELVSMGVIAVDADSIDLSDLEKEEKEMGMLHSSGLIFVSRPNRNLAPISCNY
jgi:hypothetical protein